MSYAIIIIIITTTTTTTTIIIISGKTVCVHFQPFNK